MVRRVAFCISVSSTEARWDAFAAAAASAVAAAFSTGLLLLPFCLEGEVGCDDVCCLEGEVAELVEFREESFAIAALAAAFATSAGTRDARNAVMERIGLSAVFLCIV